MRPRRLLAERFWERVDQRGDDECWPWLGAWRSRYGYGRIRLGGRNGRSTGAHRLAYELRFGPVPDGQLIRHLVCDNPICCNPAHLRPGTALDNAADRVRRHGR